MGPNVLVTGGNFKNQGAFLMLVAAGIAVRDYLGGRPVIPLRFGTARQRIDIGYETLLAEERFGVRPRLPQLPRRARDHSPYLFTGDIDAVLDVTGFAFGDQWYNAPLMRRAQNYEWWASRGVPVVMLPQAFGPFELTGEPSRRAISASSAVYPRDETSFKHVEGLLGAASHRRMARYPDFTVKVPARKPEKLTIDEPYWCIVPNWNIYERADKEDARRYVAGLVRVTRFIGALGGRAVGVCHEGARDLELLQEVKREYTELELVSGLNGLELKFVLGRAQGVVSGRYHAIISALSQGVPTVMHGWSHKYSWLAADFGWDGNCVSPFDGGDATIDLLNSYAEAREEMSKSLILSTEKVHSVNLAMWREVAQILEVEDRI
ncbi:putative polysaccharide biosynthesis protein [Gordonia alkanivorans NBRC 16433]|uniref:Putative polysaccharide biosynthesis protein n=2 Tax=Gordonia alkanivorans TaxID=84096 RepID=F9VRF3_9ACTN|nr:putative polysaccharide biosynthesis protein [Gordonia alkanivorans NBRC 16433]